ncbi:VOC family protein [Streptomyces apocyni]|uniref:VOC family protein n=1 Tax=Streptomyces apocyni TaxID=2654677 RepID=UPI0012EA7AAA|nr:VOC family protein [Streptomyces apocyni]
MTAPSDKQPVLVLDAQDAQDLAEFYARFLGATARPTTNPEFIEIVGERGIVLAIHRKHTYAPPSWPRPENSQQAHLSILIAPDDMDAAEREAISLGATPVDTDSSAVPGNSRMYADPAGHSFILAAAH